jgi:hypothetical protein
MHRIDASAGQLLGLARRGGRREEYSEKSDARRERLHRCSLRGARAEVLMES